MRERRRKNERKNLQKLVIPHVNKQSKTKKKIITKKKQKLHDAEKNI